MFDLSAMLKDVSESDTGREQIEYIPLELIDGDGKNFYSMDEIESLARNIATIGLQQPLRLRPNVSAFGLSGNDEPFAIVWSPIGVMFVAMDGSEATSHKVGIYQNGTVVKTLDNKYLEPFHEESTETDILAEQTLTTYELEIVLTAGQTYYVVWDGVEYICIAATDSDGIIYLGNPDIVGFGEDTGEPFFIYVDDSVCGIETLQESSPTVRIYQKGDSVWKLNEESLPMDAIDQRIEAYISAALEGDY